MKEISIVEQFECDVDTLYNVLLHFPNLNVFEAKQIRYRSLSEWVEYSEEIDRICKMEANREMKRVIIYVYNDLSMKHYEDKFTFQINIVKGSTQLEIKAESYSSLLAKMGFYMRRYSVDLVLKTCIEKIKIALS